MALTSRPLLLHPLATRQLARRLLDRSVPRRGRVAALGRRSWRGLGVRLVLLA